MYIQIKPELEQFIQAQLASGRFTNADDVINEAFKLLQGREQRLEELRQKISVGTEQIAKGQVTDGEVVFARLQEEIRLIAEESSEWVIIHFSDAAIRDLDEICEYIARSNPKVASKLFDDIRTKCKLVASFPNMGKSYGRLVPNLRGFVVDDYIIFYCPR